MTGVKPDRPNSGNRTVNFYLLLENWACIKFLINGKKL